MQELKCLRCKHKWYPRVPKFPKLCPSCKSKYWDQKRDDKEIKRKKVNV